jgi:hypothetical protein
MINYINQVSQSPNAQLAINHISFRVSSSTERIINRANHPNVRTLQYASYHPGEKLKTKIRKYILKANISGVYF